MKWKNWIEYTQTQPKKKTEKNCFGLFMGKDKEERIKYKSKVKRRFMRYGSLDFMSSTTIFYSFLFFKTKTKQNRNYSVLLQKFLLLIRRWKEIFHFFSSSSYHLLCLCLIVKCWCVWVRVGRSGYSCVKIRLFPKKVGTQNKCIVNNFWVHYEMETQRKTNDCHRCLVGEKRGS